MAAEYANRETRLSFLELDSRSAELLSSFWKSARPEMPAILDDFYRRLYQAERTRSLLEKACSVDSLKDAQTSHWEQLFTSGFDQAWFESARRIGRIHHRIGLEPQWYMAAYSFMLSRLLAVATRRNLLRPGKLQELHDAIVKAVMLDAEIAISVYGELMVEEENRRAAELDAMVRSFDEDIRKPLSSVEDASSSLSRMASELKDMARRSAGEVDDATSRVAHLDENIRSVYAATEQMAASISEIGNQATESAAVSEKASREVETANGKVRELIAASESIGEIISLIRDITDRTELLSINASIEASRAGESGKGFAVVAGEVKSLAGQTGKATREIVRNVDSIRSVSGEVVDTIANMEKVIAEVCDTSRSIAAAVEQQRMAVGDVTHNMNAAADRIGALACHFGEASAFASNLSDDASSLLESAGELERISVNLTKRVSAFLQEVKEAR